MGQETLKRLYTASISESTLYSVLIRCLSALQPHSVVMQTRVTLSCSLYKVTQKQETGTNCTNGKKTTVAINL